MNGNRKGPYVLMAVIALMMAFFVVAFPAPVQADENPALPPDFTLHGKTGNEWNAEWWQWAFKIPLADHPMAQTGDVDCGAYQHGRVWFLGGAFGGVGSGPTRTCTIPKNTYLWFPVLNWVFWRPGDFVTDQEGHDAVRFYGDGTENVLVTVDGVPVPNVEDYRYHSDIFKFKIQSGGVFEGDPNNTEYPHLIPGVMYDGIDDGYYMMLKPLPAGDHTIHFSADSPFFGGFSVDMTYYITVTE
jgi:hypothetical protein